MAEEFPKRSEQLSIDRRRLLKTSLAITTANLAPDVALSETVPVVSAQTVFTASEAILNVCTKTPCRLADIERRNLLRRQSGLPLLSVAREYRRLKTLEAAEDFARFSERFRARVIEKVLARIRRQKGDPMWKPQGTFQGMALQNEVSKRLGRLYALL